MFWLNLATAFGTLLLAFPVIRLNRNKKILQRLRNSEQQSAGDALGDRLRKTAEDKMRDEIASWKPWHEYCLLGGYVLIAIGAVGRLLLPV